MKKPLILLALAGLALDSAQAQTTVPVRSVYADFGPNDGTNGNSTPSPDVNGNYWNNIQNNTAVADTFRLLDKAGQATGIKLKVGPNFLTNGIVTGGLLAPSAALLGQYAIATATQDYFFVQGTGSTATGTLRISGLDRSKRYVFHVFGSRNATTETRVSQYRFVGAATSTITQTTTGPNVGANGYAGNNNTITDSDTLAADGSGVITMELSKASGSFAYLNLMRIDVVPGRNNAPAVYYAFQNPGFELGNLNFWTTVARGTGAAATVSSTTKRSGSYAAQLTGGSLGLEQQISYRAATGVNSYRLSGYFYNPSAAALSGSQSAHLELLYYNSSMALLGRFKSDSLLAASPTNVWTRLEAVGTIPAGTAFVKAAAVWRNAAGTATGSVYFDDLALQAYYPQNPNKIAFIGSSVLTGVGSTMVNGSYRGYTTLYSELLTRRAAVGAGGPWVTTNLGVPGNNTIDVLGRFENDVLPTGSKYVLVGLVLGNEGIITGGQTIFDQFRTNMQRIIGLARTDGLTPVVALGYGRNDYTATQYTFVRQMNLLLHGWSVPTVNLLGGVDDGNGRYATGYWFDSLHPNDLGHTELMYTLVPSLFDALNANKPLPRRQASNGITLTKTTGAPTRVVHLVPEDVVHPFTQAIRFKTAGAGRLVEIRDSAGIAAGTLSVSSGGVVTYQSAKGGSITGTVAVANNRWHKLVLTHYYARGATMLYVDSVKEGTVQERLRPTQLNLGGPAAPTRVQFRDWMFWRAGMNQDEILAVAADSLLKGSLEIYAPLDGRRVATTDSLANLAQSTNTLARLSGPLAVRESAFAAQISLYPNPTAGLVSFAGPMALDGTSVTVFDVLGKAVLATRLRGSQLDLRSLPPGVYSLVLDTRDGQVHKRLVRQE